MIVPKAYAVACLNTKIIWLVHHELRLATGLSINKHFSFVGSVALGFVGVVVCLFLYRRSTWLLLNRHCNHR